MIVSHQNYRLAEEIFTEYSLKPYSRHIATLSALACLAQLMSDLRPEFVVEVGGGIGTMTDLLGRHGDRPSWIVTYETDAVCLEQLRLLDTRMGIVEIITDPSGFVNRPPADLLIIDACLRDQALLTIQIGTTLFFEGNRGPEREHTEIYLKNQGMNVELIEHKLEMRGEPVPGKGCWMGKCVRLQ